jgi:hypothetical protein
MNAPTTTRSGFNEQSPTTRKHTLIANQAQHPPKRTHITGQDRFLKFFLERFDKPSSTIFRDEEMLLEGNVLALRNRRCRGRLEPAFHLTVIHYSCLLRD